MSDLKKIKFANGVVIEVSASTYDNTLRSCESRLEDKIALLERKLELCKKQRDQVCINKCIPRWSNGLKAVKKFNKELEELK